MAALECVDYVVLFEEDEPRDLIAAVLPDILVKGADWAHYVSGRDVVEAAGGRVGSADLVPVAVDQRGDPEDPGNGRNGG
jgi:bifunctional ADP-heptose synthase (sugar kinase/adenylyltransferase)